jgi:nitrogen regulatory protein PII
MEVPAQANKVNSDSDRRSHMSFKCIIAMVKPDLTDKVVESAKKIGATGATIIDASGTGAREAKTFFGLTLDIRTEVVLFLVNEDLVDSVLSAIRKAGRFHEPGTGIAFVLNVESTIGFESQLSERKA